MPSQFSFPIHTANTTAVTDDVLRDFTLPKNEPDNLGLPSMESFEGADVDGESTSGRSDFENFLKLPVEKQDEITVEIDAAIERGNELGWSSEEMAEQASIKSGYLVSAPMLALYFKRRFKSDGIQQTAAGKLDRDFPSAGKLDRDFLDAERQQNQINHLDILSQSRVYNAIKDALNLAMAQDRSLDFVIASVLNKTGYDINENYLRYVVLPDLGVKEYKGRLFRLQDLGVRPEKKPMPKRASDSTGESHKGCRETRPPHTKHTLEFKCPKCGKVWAQPDWYKDTNCPYCANGGKPITSDGTPKIQQIARTKLGDRNVHWEEMYTRDTAWFKTMYEDLVGPGCYFRWEGRDGDNGDEYFAVVGPAKMHDPEPKFFAGTRKLPNTYAAGGLYFNTLSEAIEYAADTWGIVHPKHVRLTYSSKDLRGLSVEKMDAWRDSHSKDEVFENFRGPTRDREGGDTEDVAYIEDESDQVPSGLTASTNFPIRTAVSTDVDPEMVFHAATRGGRYETKVFYHPASQTYSYKEYRNGSVVGAGDGYKKEEVAGRITSMLVNYSRVDKINQSVLLDKEGLFDIVNTYKAKREADIKRMVEMLLKGDQAGANQAFQEVAQREHLLDYEAVMLRQMILDEFHNQKAGKTTATADTSFPIKVAGLPVHPDGHMSQQEQRDHLMQWRRDRANSPVGKQMREELGMAEPEYCPQCSAQTDDFYEGVCLGCREENQRKLHTHQQEYEEWMSLSDEERARRIRSRMAEALFTFPIRLGMATVRYQNREPYMLFDVDAVQNHRDPRWPAATAQTPSLNRALTIASYDRRRKQTWYAWNYGTDRVEEVYKHYIAYHPLEGTYLVSVGPYVGDYFGQAVHKFYAGYKKLNLVRQEEIERNMNTAIHQYVAQYADRNARGQINPASIGLTSADFNLPEPDDEGWYDNNKLSLNVDGQQKVNQAIARRFGIDTSQENWEELAATALEREQRQWLQEHQEFLPPNANVATVNGSSLDSIIKRIWLQYRRKLKSGEVWDNEIPPPPQLRNNLVQREGQQGYRSVYREPKFIVVAQPSTGGNTFRVLPGRGESATGLRRGHRIRFIYGGGRRLFGKKLYQVDHVSRPAQDTGMITVTLREPYGMDGSQENAWEKDRNAESIEVQMNTVQTLSIGRQTIEIDWARPAREIAEVLGVTVERAKELKNANTVLNFGFNNLGEAIQHMTETGLKITDQDKAKLAIEKNVTSEDLANRNDEAIKARPADAKPPVLPTIDSEEETTSTTPTTPATPKDKKTTPSPALVEKPAVKEKTAPPKPAAPPVAPVTTPTATPQPDVANTTPPPEKQKAPPPSVEEMLKRMRPQKIRTHLEAYKHMMKLAERMEQAGYTDDAQEVRRLMHMAEDGNESKQRMTVVNALRWAETENTTDGKIKKLEALRDGGISAPGDIKTINQAIKILQATQTGMYPKTTGDFANEATRSQNASDLIRDKINGGHAPGLSHDQADALFDESQAWKHLSQNDPGKSV